MSEAAKPKRRRRWWLLLGLLVVWAAFTFVPDIFFPERDKELRTRLRQAVSEEFPEQAAALADSYGLRHLPPVLDDAPAAPFSVVLIHGLDDPGKVWMVLAPRLLAEGYDVWTMRYPNDQPIHASARFFARELAAVASDGIDAVTVISHSMGGLVSRELLTHPDIDYDGAVARGEAPRIGGLMMVGTPNHGSQLARFRALGELREQAVSLARGEAHLLGAILDGAGEAGIDLVPGSRFLEQLNARPHPSGVELLVIAGVMAAPEPAPDPAADAEHGALAPDETETAAEREAATAADNWWREVSYGLGDGLVAVESARLEGARQRVVEGNHMTIIRNVGVDSERTPPAMPIILDELAAARAR